MRDCKIQTLQFKKRACEHNEDKLHLCSNKAPKNLHLLQIVDEDHVEGLVPAAVQQKVETVDLQQVAVGTLLPSPRQRQQFNDGGHFDRQTAGAGTNITGGLRGRVRSALCTFSGNMIFYFVLQY